MAGLPAPHSPGPLEPPRKDFSAERPGVFPIAFLASPGRAAVEGRVRSVEIRPVESNCVFEATVADDTGVLTAKFYGRQHIPGVEPGARVKLEGPVSLRDGAPAMINPAYELVPRDAALPEDEAE